MDSTKTSVEDQAIAAIVEATTPSEPHGVPFADAAPIKRMRKAAPPAPIVSTQPEITPPAAVSAPTLIEDKTMDTNFTAAATETQEKAKAMFADLNDRAKGAMEKSAHLFEELNAFNKGNIEAIVESSKIAAKGLESIGQDAAEYTRKSFEGTTAAVKTLATVKSPTEFLKMQGDFMRTAFDAMIAETSKNTETMLKLAGEVVQPISNRVAVAVEKMKVAA